MNEWKVVQVGYSYTVSANCLTVDGGCLIFSNYDPTMVRGDVVHVVSQGSWKECTKV